MFFHSRLIQDFKIVSLAAIKPENGGRLSDVSTEDQYENHHQGDTDNG